MHLRSAQQHFTIVRDAVVKHSGQFSPMSLKLSGAMEACVRKLDLFSP